MRSPEGFLVLWDLHEAGIVDFDRGPGRSHAPRPIARRVTLELDLAGASSVVFVERPDVGIKSGRVGSQSRGASTAPDCSHMWTAPCLQERLRA